MRKKYYKKYYHKKSHHHRSHKNHHKPHHSHKKKINHKDIKYNNKKEEIVKSTKHNIKTESENKYDPHPNYTEDKPIKSKTFDNSFYKFKKWFFHKKGSRYIQKEKLLIYSGVTTACLFIFLAVHSNIDMLNDVVFWIIKLGSIIQLTLFIIIVWSIYKTLLYLKHGFKGLINGVKLILIVTILLSCLLIYQHPYIITKHLTEFEYTTFNPFTINFSDINWSYQYNESSYNTPTFKENVGFMCYHERNPTPNELDDMYAYFGYRNPTYSEIVEFINQDRTDENEYIIGAYVCEDFSKDVIKNARNKGYIAGFVHLHEPGGFGHAIVCFNTSDKGLYFVEPQLDVIFDEIRMNNMIYQGLYDIDVHYGGPYGAGAYFHMSLSGYSIDWFKDRAFNEEDYWRMYKEDITKAYEDNAKYLDNEIFVNGTWIKNNNYNYDGVIVDTSKFIFHLYADIPENIVLIDHKEYVFIGTLKFIDEMYYINVTEIAQII